MIYFIKSNDASHCFFVFMDINRGLIFINIHLKNQIAIKIGTKIADMTAMIFIGIDLAFSISIALMIWYTALAVNNNRILS